MAAVQFVPVSEVVSSSGAGVRCVPELTGAIDGAQARTIAEVCAALSHPTRLRIVVTLRSMPDATASGCDLLERVGVSESVMRDHLRALVDVGVISQEQRGVSAWYTVNPDGLVEILALVGESAAAPV